MKFVLILVIVVVNQTIFSNNLGSQQEAIEVPKGSLIMIDGKISESEWKGALTTDLSGGGKLKLSHNGEFLQIGLQSDKGGLSHVYLTDGQSIYVLHASAALGMAIYRKDGEIWQPIQKFKWELRDQSMSEEAIAARETYFKTNGWVANVDKTGKVTEREYKIAMKFREGETFRLAVAYAANPASPQFYPQSLTDDTLKRELIFGTEPPNLSFNKEQWSTLKLKSDSAKTLSAQSLKTTEIFGKDVISKGRIYRGSFSPDGKTFYFFKKTGEGEKYGIFVSNNSGGKWSEPERLLLGGDFSDLYPSISRDGKRMVFCSYRPAPNDSSGKPNSYLWLVEKKGNGWGEPVFLDQLNTMGNYHSWVEFGAKDTIYFRNTSPDWRTEYAWFSRLNGKEFGKPEVFQEVEQFRKWREDLFVWGGALSPDGKALFLDVSQIDAATKRRSRSDLWVSLKQGNKWSEPKKLGEKINSPETENFFFFSPNGKELFFTREYAAFHRIPFKEALKTIQ